MRKITFMQVKFNNLAPPTWLLWRLDEAYDRVMSSGQYIRGKEIAAFEEEWAGYVGTKHCIGTGSGSDALRWLVRYNSVVVHAPWNSTPTLDALWGEKIILHQAETGGCYNFKPEAERRYETAIAVHLYGCPANVDKIQAFMLLEDAAQAHGARYKGKMCGALAKAAAWSFYPTKNLGAYGDAGAITTGDEDLANWLRPRTRIDPLQAAFLRVKLPYLNANNVRRREIAAQYLEGIETVELPKVPEWAEPCWHLFTIRHPNRDLLQDALAQVGIETLVRYEVDKEVLSLPCAPHLTDTQVKFVIEMVNQKGEKMKGEMKG